MYTLVVLTCYIVVSMCFLGFSLLLLKKFYLILFHLMIVFIGFRTHYFKWFKDAFFFFNFGLIQIFLLMFCSTFSFLNMFLSKEFFFKSRFRRGCF